MNNCNRILIFGGTGSLGKTLIKRFGQDKNVFAYSRDESKHWTLRNELHGTKAAENTQFLVGDIRDTRRVSDAIRRVDPDIIIIAAALKQVDTCELTPDESILTNLIGTQNVVEGVVNYSQTINKNRLMKTLFVSTDKACSPVNVYGMCKAISERVVTSVAADRMISNDNCRFLGVRYGNVLESRGSIIPLFKHQAEFMNELTVTHPDMTRFVMTLDDSVDLIEKTLNSGSTGEIWIPRLRAMRIGDLADIFARRHKKTVKCVGLRPGEKMHEALINESESIRSRDQDGHIVINPAFMSGDRKPFEYTSADDVMTSIQLEEHLTKLGIFEYTADSFVGRTVDDLNVPSRKKKK